MKIQTNQLDHRNAQHNTTQHNTTRDYEILIRPDPDNWQSMLNMHSAKRSKPNKEDNPSQKD